jgi:pilus assembly protein Flp/PilA
MRVLLARFLCEESGATEVGYALIVAGMAVAIITVLSGLGSKLSMALTTVRAALEWAWSSAAARTRRSGGEAPHLQLNSRAESQRRRVSIDARECGF